MKSNEIEHASCEKMLTSFGTLSCDKNDRKVRQLTGVCHKHVTWNTALTAVNVEYVLSVLFLTLKDVLGFWRCCHKCFLAAPSWCYAEYLVLKVLHKTDTSHISSMMSARSLILLLFALFCCRILGNLFYNTTCLLQIWRFGWKWGFEKIQPVWENQWNGSH